MLPRLSVFSFKQSLQDMPTTDSRPCVCLVRFKGGHAFGKALHRTGLCQPKAVGLPRRKGCENWIWALGVYLGTVDPDRGDVGFGLGHPRLCLRDRQ